MSGSGMQPGAPEVEWQFEAPDLEAVRRWLDARPPGGVPHARFAGERELVDEYYDTADWQCFRAGYGLRVRRTDSAAEATLKTLAAAGDGPARRVEISEPLPQGALPGPAGGPVSGRLRTVTGSRPLLHLFTVRTRRRAYALERDGHAVAELVLDDTVIVAPDVPETPLRRVEIEEQAPGALDALASFVDELRAATGLTPADGKFEAAIRLCGLRPPSRGVPGA